MIKAIFDRLAVTVTIRASGVKIFFQFGKSAIFDIRNIYLVILRPDHHVVKGI